MSAGLLLVATWAVLLGGTSLVAPFGPSVATLLVFLAATLVVWGARARSPRVRWRTERSPGREALAAGLAAAAGWAGLPAWSTFIASLGLALGLRTSETHAPLSHHDLAWIAALCVAPWFEEPLYRERILLALRARAGGSAAVLVSSVAFALPHASAWSLLGTFCVGIALGTAAIRWRSLGVCLGLHLGLNLAIAGWGLPPVGHPLEWQTSLAVSALLVAGAARVLGVRAARPVPSPPTRAGTSR